MRSGYVSSVAAQTKQLALGDLLTWCHGDGRQVAEPDLHRSAHQAHQFAVCRMFRHRGYSTGDDRLDGRALGSSKVQPRVGTFQYGPFPEQFTRLSAWEGRMTGGCAGASITIASAGSVPLRLAAATMETDIPVSVTAAMPVATTPTATATR